jgi:hypothetical protein
MRRYKAIGVSMSRTEPAEWAKFCKLNQSYPFADFSLPASTVVGQANRYRARYSLVSDVNRVEINNCNDDTADGYTQLMRVVMAWGAVESFFNLKGIGINSGINRINHLKPLYDATLESNLRNEFNNSEYLKFFGVVHNECTNNKHTQEIGSYLANPSGNYELSYLISGIRHIFAHGILTPHSGKIKPKTTIEICEKLIDFFLSIIDLEFSKLVKNHPRYATV